MRLDEAMKEAGYGSQSALSRASGVPQPTINRILKGGGKRGPETETIRKLAGACGVRFQWLMEGTGPRKEGEPEEATEQRNSRPALRPVEPPRDPALIRPEDILELISLYGRANEPGRFAILSAARGVIDAGAVFNTTSSDQSKVR